MRHEITRHAVVGVIEQNFHSVFSNSAKRGFAACLAEEKNRQRRGEFFPWRLSDWTYAFETAAVYCTAIAAGMGIEHQTW
jgi:hypothetical protein